MKKYATYKESGVDWLGQIPNEWQVKPLRAVLKLRNEKNDPVQTEQILSLSIANGVTLYSHKGRGGNKAKGDLSAYKIAHVGDIVMNSMNVIVGAVGLSKYDGAISPVYYALYSSNESVDINYFEKIFRSKSFQKFLMIYGKGILIKKSNSGKLNTIRMKISSNDLRTTNLPVPPTETQKSISQFLDSKLRDIEKIISNKQKYINLLKEFKQSKINELVTRGLDSSIILKDTGIKWIGYIPKHWRVMKLKKIVTLNSSNSTSFDNKIALENIESWTGKRIELDGTPFQGDGVPFENGDILFCKLRPYLAKVYLAKEDGTCVNELLVLKTKPNIISKEFIFTRLLTYDFIQLVNSSTYGAKMPRASWDFIGEIEIPFPPNFEEQSQIFERCNEINIGVEASIEKEKSQIELLNQYRQSLIYELVTGKRKP